MTSSQEGTLSQKLQKLFNITISDKLRLYKLCITSDPDSVKVNEKKQIQQV